MQYSKYKYKCHADAEIIIMPFSEIDPRLFSLKGCIYSFSLISFLIGRYCCFFCRFRDKLGVKVVKALKRNDDGVTHAAIDMLCALMQVTFHYKTFHELHVLYLFWFCEFFCKLKPLILYLFGFKPILAIS